MADNTTGGNCYVENTGTLTDGGGNLRHPMSDISCTGDYGSPRLSAPAFNGGPTKTMALSWDSDAINRIDGDNGCGVGVTTDQRGMRRPQPSGWRCDIGAYEKRYDDNEVDIRCFIASAAFGSHTKKQVTTLRQFRDRFLLPHKYGRSFVDWYYENSPRWGMYILRHDWMRKAVRTALFPAYMLALAALNWNMQATLLSLLIILLWPMGKRKFALAGMRLLITTSRRILK